MVKIRVSATMAEIRITHTQVVMMAMVRSSSDIMLSEVISVEKVKGGHDDKLIIQ